MAATVATSAVMTKTSRLRLRLRVMGALCIRSLAVYCKRDEGLHLEWAIQLGDMDDCPAHFIHQAIAHPGTRTRLLACAERILRNRADAEDCVQEALLAASRQAVQFESRASPLAWLHRIVENVCRMQRRAARRIRRGGDFVFVPLEEANDVVGDASHPERVLLENDALGGIDDELGRMAGHDARLFVRHVVEGVPIAVLAREQQVSRSAIKSRLFRVRRKLREAA